MNALITLLLLAQPIMPELHPPPELEPSHERPVVIPLEHDTLGVGMALGAPFGFELLARQDGPFLLSHAALSIHERTDHFHGLQQLGKTQLVANIKSLQIAAGIQGLRYENTALPEWFDRPAMESRSYADAWLQGLWHHSDLLVGVETQAYTSTMSGAQRSGGRATARIFAARPWAKMLSKTQARLNPEGMEFLTDAIFQYQAGFMLITPSLEGRLAPAQNNPAGAGASLNLVAVLGNLSLKFEGCYRRKTPLLLDSVLLAPVQATLAPQVQGHILADRLQVGAGYEGVEVSIFTEQGEGLFWRTGPQGFPQVELFDFNQTGCEVGAKLERDKLSLVGKLRFGFSEPQTPWTPLWELTDSMSVKFTPLEAFVLIGASGERRSEEVYESSYALLGCGVFYEREPFRVALRADDLLDRRPQLWPGLPDAGRRFSLSVALFSTDW
jgi:hypothetical protein